ncbi:MAG: hypothetical protein R3F30_07250 [Planctomycetota bacterium]
MSDSCDDGPERFVYLPEMYMDGGEGLLAMMDRLREEGIPFDLDASAAMQPGSSRYSLPIHRRVGIRIRDTDAPAIAKAWFSETIYADKVSPVDGPCPDCGEELVQALRCPACGLSFMAELGTDDPWIRFLLRFHPAAVLRAEEDTEEVRIEPVAGLADRIDDVPEADETSSSWPLVAAVLLLALQATAWLGAVLCEAFDLSGAAARSPGWTSYGAVKYLCFGLAPLALVLAGGIHCHVADGRDGRSTARAWWTWAPLPNLFFLALGIDVLFETWARGSHWSRLFGLLGTSIWTAVLFCCLTIAWFVWLAWGRRWRCRRRVLVPIGVCFLLPVFMIWALYAMPGH